MINKEKHFFFNIRAWFVDKAVQMLHLENIITVYLRLSGMLPPRTPTRTPSLANLCFAANGFVHGAENKKRLFSEAQIWINVSIKAL